MQAGRWPGLWSFYARYPDRHRREALAGDWLSALRYAQRQAAASQPATARHLAGQVIGLAHISDTRSPQHTGGCCLLVYRR